MNIYLGEDLIGSVTARTTESLKLDYNLESDPDAYGMPRKFGSTDYAIDSAGDVYSFMVYKTPTSSSNLESEIKKLKEYISQKKEEAVIYGQFLRVANILTVLKEFEQNNINQILSTAGSDLQGIFYTHGKGGIVKDRADRPYGAIPEGTGISWISGGKNYSRSGDFTEYSDYKNLTQFNLLSILYGSQIEANVWEILYGVPGGSSTKLMQLIAQDIFVNGKPNILISDKQLGVGLDAEILAIFEDDMVGTLVQALGMDKSFVQYKSIVYSHKRKFSLDNGFKGSSLLILPVDPRAGAIALYSGQAPSVGGIGSMGGGSLGGAVNSKPLPAKVDPNDSERKGSATSCNPVSYSTGDMFHEFTDFAVAGRTAGTTLKFERKYSTKSYKALGDLGPDWTHNFQTRLISEGFDDLRPELTTNIIWIKEGGNKVVFSRNLDGTFTAPSGINDHLTENSNDFTIKRKGGNFYSYAKNKLGVTNGRLLYFEEVHGERITLNYDFNKRLQSVEAPFAGSIIFNYDESGRITSLHRNRDNLTYSYTYGTDGYLSTSADFDNNQTKYEYVKDRPSTKAQNLLTKIIDPLNQEITFEYYDDGRVFQEVGKGAAKSTYFYSYFLVDQLTRMRGENGATKLYKFDDQYRLIETEYEDGSRTKQVWDSESNMSASIDELGYETKFVYDQKGNKIGIKAPEHSAYIRTEYHPDFDKPTKMIPLLGAVTINTFDSNTSDLLKTEKQDSIGSLFLEFTNDQFGNVITTRNNYVSYSDVRDGNGLLTEKYDARNPINLEYDSRGRVIRRTYESGKIIDIEYDNFDRTTKITNNVGPDIVNIYDVLGRLTARTVTDGLTAKTTRYEYDARDRQVAIIDSLGRRTEKKYDIPGLGCKYVVDQPIEVIDPKGRSTKYSYDSKNRLVRNVTPDGTVTRREYNDRGDLIGITDGSGNRTAFLYDGNQRMIRKERASSKSANNGDAQAAKEITTYKYDEADRVIREEMLLPEEQNGTEVAMLVTEYSYNELGQQIKKTIKKEFMGQVDILDVSNFVYRRVLDGPVQLQANNQTANLEFLFENTPPFSIVGYRVKAANSNNPLNLVEGEFAITPDFTGQIKNLDKDGLTNSLFENEYDPEGRLTKKTSRFNGHRLITNVAYDSFGRKKTVAHDNGLTGSFSYDSLDRLVSTLWNGTGESFQENITYDLLTGNITKIQRELGDFDYSYDSNDQLQKVVYSGTQGLEGLVNRDLGYDRAGNRLVDTISGNGSFIRNVITENDKYRYYSDPNGFGNIVQKTNKLTGEINIYDYLTDGKIRKFTKYEKIPNSTQTMAVDYYYDALGRRVAKKIKTPSREFTQTYSYLANEDKILFAKKGSGEVQMEVDGQGIDEHLGEITIAGIKTFTNDHLGTVINGEIVGGKKATGAFGEVLSTISPIETTSNPTLYGYTGRQLDQESGIYYYRNRYYDPQSGRFMSKDPIGINGGDVNLYRYVGNSPVSLVDPNGNELVSFIIYTLLLIVPEPAGQEVIIPRYEVKPISPDAAPDGPKARKKEERKIEKKYNLEKNSCRLT